MEEMVKMLYNLPKESTKTNREIITLKVKEWATNNGLPYCNEKVVTGMEVVKVEVDVDVNVALEFLKNNKVYDHDTVSDDSMPVGSQELDIKIPHINVTTIAENEIEANAKSNRKNKSVKNIKVSPVVPDSTIADNDAGEENETVVEEVTAVVNQMKNKKKNNKNKQEPEIKESVEVPEVKIKSLENKAKASNVKAKAPQIKAKSSESKVKAPEPSIVPKSPKRKLEPIEQPPTKVQKLESQPQESQLKENKSVTWGSNQVKQFFKKVTICTMSEAKTSPKITATAPKVLKDTGYVKQLLPYTAGAKKSGRKNKKK